MTTLAIIGSGIVGRSLLYTLAKEQKQFKKITLFYSEQFTFPCTWHSTAIVAPRGVTRGHSALGDLIIEGYNTFADHVKNDRPLGVEAVTQYTGATDKLETFKARYPQGSLTKQFLKNETYLATEGAYLIDPKTYCDWLLKEAQEKLQIEIINDFVTVVENNDSILVKTLNGQTHNFDKIIFAGGNFNRFWKDLAPESKLKTSKPVQGSYFEFNDVNWEIPSFSLTLDGDNLIWNQRLKRLLVGSTTSDTNHLLPPKSELRSIYERLSKAVDLKLPHIDQGEVKVGLREKAQKREPYLINNGNIVFLGGLYKNGFILSLRMTRTLSHQHL